MKDNTLLDSVRKLLSDERRTCIDLVRMLLEIERRRLHAKRGYSSLWQMLIEYYRCSRSATGQRIAVLELYKRVPESEPLLASGEISFSVFAEVGRVSERTGRDPRELLIKVAGKTCREAEKILLAALPTKNYKDYLRPLPGGIFELRVILSKEQSESWEKLRGIRSHAGPTHGELLGNLIELGLKTYDPMTQTSDPTSDLTGSDSETIPLRNQVFVWRRDGGACVFVDKLTGKKCGSTFFLQFDHIIPRALGGTHDPGNLRLYCQTHNLLAAAEIFGEEKIKGRPTAKSGAASEPKC